MSLTNMWFAPPTDTSESAYIHPPPPNNRPHPILPPELHFKILEETHWTSHPTLSKTCKLWHHFLKTSPTIQNSHYEPPLESLYFKGRARPQFHNVLAHIQTFARKEGGTFHIRKIHLNAPRDKWGRYKQKGSEEWVTPKIRLAEFDYDFFKDEPIMCYTDEGGDKVPLMVTETSYTPENAPEASGKPASAKWPGQENICETVRFDENVTVGDHITQLSLIIESEEEKVEQQRLFHQPGNESNVVWLSVYETVKHMVWLRFALRAVRYEIEPESLSS
ncbi:hypothetical protein TWF730_006343 [Orbilia blumenaviensis]|uniref:F-box domain-containing protein n=1 Tax=Orbilia blumenaviensis TaxID=1796055 RepID=A0AAV9VDZ9_9PEZI